MRHASRCPIAAPRRTLSTLTLAPRPPGAHSRRFTKRDGSRGASAPLIETPSNGLLCFYKLVEVYLIHVLRKGLEGAPICSMRRLRACLREPGSGEGGARHPLAHRCVVSRCLGLRAQRGAPRALRRG